MNRKILKIVISLLFLAVSVIGVIFAFLTHSNKPLKQNNQDDEIHKLDPWYLKEVNSNATKYGIAYPVPVPEGKKYGVASIRMSDRERELKKEEARKKAMEADVEKYGVFPVNIEPIEEYNQKK